MSSSLVVYNIPGTTHELIFMCLLNRLLGITLAETLSCSRTRLRIDADGNESTVLRYIHLSLFLSISKLVKLLELTFAWWSIEILLPFSSTVRQLRPRLEAELDHRSGSVHIEFPGKAHVSIEPSVDRSSEGNQDLDRRRRNRHARDDRKQTPSFPYDKAHIPTCAQA